MKSIRKDAEKLLLKEQSQANDQIRTDFIGSNDQMFELFTLRTYAEHEAGTNPDFFSWLFDDDSIESFGRNLSAEQKIEYRTWLHDL